MGKFMLRHTDNFSDNNNVVHIYFGVNYLHCLKRCFRYSTLPFTDCIRINPMTPIQVNLYIASVADHCILKITELNYIPLHLIKVLIDGPVSFEMQSSWCSTYLIIKRSKINIEIEQNRKSIYKLPTTIPVPFYMKSTVQSIIEHLHCVKIMFGSNVVYMLSDINLTTEDTYQEIVESRS